MGQDESRAADGRGRIFKASTLPRLRLTDDEISDLVPELERVLEHIDRIVRDSADGADPIRRPQKQDRSPTK